MNKRVLKSYLKGSNKQILETSCFAYDNGFIICDSYSVIKLNDTNDLEVNTDILGVCKFYDDFSNNFEFIREFERSFWDGDETIGEIALIVSSSTLRLLQRSLKKPA